MGTGANPRYANGHRRRQVRARVLAAYDTCALCHELVDKTLRLGVDGKPHPLSPEVDEILPVSRGGSPLQWSNVQLAHRICNQRKGNRLESDVTPLLIAPDKTSRDWFA